MAATVLGLGAAQDIDTVFAFDLFDLLFHRIGQLKTSKF